jgi:hypothetical protein
MKGNIQAAVHRMAEAAEKKSTATVTFWPVTEVVLDPAMDDYEGWCSVSNGLGTARLICHSALEAAARRYFPDAEFKTIPNCPQVSTVDILDELERRDRGDEGDDE